MTSSRTRCQPLAAPTYHAWVYVVRGSCTSLSARYNWQERSQELIIFQGSADAALRRLAAPAGKLRILAVHAHADVCIEEVDAEARVRASLASLPGSSAQLELH